MRTLSDKHTYLTRRNPQYVILHQELAGCSDTPVNHNLHVVILFRFHLEPQRSTSRDARCLEAFAFVNLGTRQTVLADRSVDVRKIP